MEDSFSVPVNRYVIDDLYSLRMSAYVQINQKPKQMQKMAAIANFEI